MFLNSDFIEKSILGALSFLKESLFADEYALKKGFLQSLDPRVKTATFLFFIALILFSTRIPAVVCLYAFCLLLAQVSNISLLFFLKRTWIFIPLFSLFIAVPALFSTFSPGEIVATINFPGVRGDITRQGLLGAILFVSRVIASVSYAILLSLTTRHFELLKVLRVFKVPHVFVMTTGMCYRYIYLLVEMIENTYRAIKSRVGARVHYRKGQRIVAWNIACLWSRSYYLSAAVYQAMLSRGYRGEPVVMQEFRLRAIDKVWIIIVTMFSAGVWSIHWLVKG